MLDIVKRDEDGMQSAPLRDIDHTVSHALSKHSVSISVGPCRLVGQLSL